MYKIYDILNDKYLTNIFKINHQAAQHIRYSLAGNKKYIVIKIK